MASKLENAQMQYEKLLRSLGHKAEMVRVFEKADPELLQAYRKAKEALSDRQLELEFIDSEIERIRKERQESQEQLQGEMAELKTSIKKQQKTIEVKKAKIGPLKSKLAGAEYDLKYIEKGLEEEHRKLEQARESEDVGKASKHEEKIKIAKLEVLKKKQELDNLRGQIRELENPAYSLKDSIEESGERIAELESELTSPDNGGNDEIQEDLYRQKDEKQRDVRRSEQHVLDTMADVAEDLYEQRISHPVLDKYYADIDRIAEIIDKLQEEND